MCAAMKRSGSDRQRLMASCEMVVLPVPTSPMKEEHPAAFLGVVGDLGQRLRCSRVAKAKAGSGVVVNGARSSPKWVR